jgi:tetratricopeptide (TPR) repeat protein
MKIIKTTLLLILINLLSSGCSNKAKKINELEIRAVYLKAQYFDNNDSIHKALNLMKSAYLLDSNRISTNIHLGSIYSILKDYPKVIYYSRKILQEDENRAEAMVELGVTYERLLKMDSAKIYYKLAYNTFIKRPKKNELKKVNDMCDAADMIVIMENDTAKALNFIKEKQRTTNNRDAKWMYDQAIKMIKIVDRKTYVKNFQ